MIDIDEVDESFKDFIKIWTNHILKPALLYDYFNIIPEDVLQRGQIDGEER